MSSDYFSVHTHSQFSGMDGMDTVQMVADRVAELGQPAFALTDHGTMGGVVQGYKAAKKHGLAFFPGAEFYVVKDITIPETRDIRWHLGIMALDMDGYERLVKLSSRSWQPDRFYRKPLIDLTDLADLSHWADHVAVTTGCYSSMVVQALLRQGKDAARNMLRMLAHWFPNTLYVELQDHGVTWSDHGGITDAEIVAELYQMAQHLGLPTVFGGDSHYVYPEEQPVHDLMKDICYFGAGEDAHFSGGPYHLLSSEEVAEKLPPNIMAAIEEGHADLLDRHALSIPQLDKYRFRVPRMFKDPMTKLRHLVSTGLDSKGLQTLPYLARADYELDVIEKMGMANYFLLVKEHVTDWCRDNGIIVNTRGSVNGSLVCYAIGISNVDPLQWSTSFDRFLSLDRQKPPDIDVDVDFRGRDRVISHLRSVFPTMVQVGTYAQIGFGKPDPETGEERGSVIVQYMAAMRSKEWPGFNGKVLPEHRDALNALADTPCFKSMGTNAAGFILPGDDYPVEKYLPLARIISSDTTVTQFNKDDVEAMGYVKMDLLGLRALQTLNGTLTRIGRQPNEWDWIPIDDKAAVELVRKGHTKGIFQFEGFTNRKGAMEMKVKTTQDMIFCTALYRPALMNGGQKDDYLANRGKGKRKQKRIHPLFDSVLDDTLGIVLYQEQVMEMLKTLGMEFQDYNDLMTAVKASNNYVAAAERTFKRIEPIFYDLCEEAGLSDEDADDAWGAVIGFTEYGFNRAHSTGYGLMAYYAAYLKAHYPVEFMASLMEVWTGVKDKEREYTTEVRRLGMSVVKPDINHSLAAWDRDMSRPSALRKGLVCIDGVGWSAAETIVAEREAGGPYKSIQDLFERVPAKQVTGGKDWRLHQKLKGTFKALYEAGAFRSVNNQ